MDDLPITLLEAAQALADRMPKGPTLHRFHAAHEVEELRAAIARSVKTLLPKSVSGKQAYEAFEWLRQFVKDNPDHTLAETAFRCWHKAAGGEIEPLQKNQSGEVKDGYTRTGMWST